MKSQPIDLTLYLNKFAAGALSLLTSRKFWLTVSAEGVLYQQLATHALSSQEFSAGTVALVVGLIVAIAHEDAGAKSQTPAA